MNLNFDPCSKCYMVTYSIAGDHIFFLYPCGQPPRNQYHIYIQWQDWCYLLLYNIHMTLNFDPCSKCYMVTYCITDDHPLFVSHPYQPHRNQYHIYVQWTEHHTPNLELWPIHQMLYGYLQHNRWPLSFLLPPLPTS